MAATHHNIFTPHPQTKDLTGRRFGKLTVISFRGYDHDGVRQRKAMWLCACDCGTQKIIAANALLNGVTVGCGCVRKARATAANTTHGMSKSRLHRVWIAMKCRCRNPNDKKYHLYGGRGIKVCDEWADSFEAFASYVGPRPSSKHTLDRINNDGNYEPGNVRWATFAEQRVNCRKDRKIEMNGIVDTVPGWAKRLGLIEGTVQYRLRRGYSIEQALSPRIKRLRSAKASK